MVDIIPTQEQIIGDDPTMAPPPDRGEPYHHPFISHCESPCCRDLEGVRRLSYSPDLDWNDQRPSARARRGGCFSRDLTGPLRRLDLHDPKAGEEFFRFGEHVVCRRWPAVSRGTHEL